MISTEYNITKILRPFSKVRAIRSVTYIDIQLHKLYITRSYKVVKC
jgi:hypothetical protein